uniref:Glutamate 5-kinase n=1 Tax=uncultured Verrucomicrobiota bacterium TaxID=156588 RepID=D2DXX2_9BACT|nr:glutamate 5 [uncultured Verrucomicrobiota bacterium]
MASHRKRIVLKFGSGILATPRGTNLDQRQFVRLTREIAALVESGNEVLVVSSGAVAAGLGAMGLRERPDDLAARQACAAVGQGRLMATYTEHFQKHQLTVAQLLLTHGDLDSRIAYSNIRTTINRLLASRVVPIINENDTVAVEELKFGDNDRLSAEVAILAEAELLILLTSVDGLLDAKGRTISRVDDIEKVERFVREEKGRLSVGGMASKLQAVKAAVEAGIPTVIASGRKAGRIVRAAAGQPAGTYFPPLVPLRAQ